MGRFIIYGAWWAGKNEGGGGGTINPRDSKRGHHEIHKQMSGPPNLLHTVNDSSDQNSAYIKRKHRKHS